MKLFNRLGFRSFATSASKVLVVGDYAAFRKLVDAPEKKVFYFTAVWCPPCKKIAPYFERISAMHPDITFAKIDVDENPEAATFSSITSIPTFQFRSGSNKLKEFAGADETGLLNAVKELQNHK